MFITDFPRTECGGTSHNETGWIASPDSNGDGYYDSNLDCLWKIYTTKDHVIGFKIGFLDIENTVECTRDFLFVSVHVIICSFDYCKLRWCSVNDNRLLPLHDKFI